MTIGKPKKPRKLSQLNRQYLAILDQYKQETGIAAPNPYDAVVWAEAKGLMDKPRVDVFRVMARMMVRACRQDYVIDENGEPVRRRHALKMKVGDAQKTLWPNMEDMSPVEIRVSLTSRRKGSGQDILQIERDRRYYNKNYNPGDPIEMDYDYNKDVEEHFMPTDYPDAPPDDSE
jgi:hypothetical protein